MGLGCVAVLSVFLRLGDTPGPQGLCWAPSCCGWSMGRGRRQWGAAGDEQTTGPCLGHGVLVSTMGPCAFRVSQHVPLPPTCPIVPVTLGVSLTLPFFPDLVRQSRGESPACETCSPGSACLGEQHGDTCSPTGLLGDPGCPVALRSRHQGLGLDGMEGTVPGLFQGDLGTVTSTPTLALYGAVQRRGFGRGKLYSPMDGQGSLWKWDRGCCVSPVDPHPALALLAAACPSTSALSPWGQPCRDKDSPHH